MANPQVENGCTDISNEIMEVLFRTKLQGYELRVILFILRYTYGFHRPEHFLKPCFIAQEIGIKRPHISRTLKQLEVKKIITRTGNLVGFQKDYDKWELPSKVITISGNKLPSKVTKTKDKKLPSKVQRVTISGTGSVPSVVHKETKEQETKTKEVLLRNSEYGNLDVNSILNLIKEKMQIPVLDGTVKLNRQYAWNLIRKVKQVDSENYMAIIEQCLDIAVADEFWHNKITSVKDLWQHFVKIYSTVKQGGQNERKTIIID